MKEKKVYFKNNKNQKLVGILHTPNIKSSSIIIMTHSLGGNKDENGMFANTARIFCSAGFNVLRYDCAGSGESDGLSRDATRMTEKADLLSAIKYIKSLNMKDIILIGLSLGANVSILAYNKNIKIICLWSSPLDTKKLIGRYTSSKSLMKELEEKGYFVRLREFGKFEMGKALMKELVEMDLKPFIKKIKCPVLVIHGAVDSVVPFSQAKDLYKLLNIPKKIEIIKGSDHNFKKIGEQKQLAKLTLNWINRFL